MQEVADSVDAGPTRTASSTSRPTLISLQSDIRPPDAVHPPTCCYLIEEFGGLENLQWQEGCRDLGLFAPPTASRCPCPQSLISLLRALRHGRHPGSPRGLRPHARPRRRPPRSQRLRERLHLQPGPTPWPRPSRAPTSSIPRVLGPLRRHGAAAPTSTPRATTPASPRSGEGAARPERHAQGLVLHRPTSWLRPPGRPGHHLSCTRLPADISGVSCEHGEVDGLTSSTCYRDGTVQGGFVQALRHRRDDLPAEGRQPDRDPPGSRGCRHSPLVPGLMPPSPASAV